MQFWGIFHLYDYGGRADSQASHEIGPWMIYDPWLLKHTEYCLWDRAHITNLAGIIEYGYPQVRKEYLRRVEEMFKTAWKKYDGIFMYTYMENMAPHYSDEYIYSDIACREYRKRYGADPRTSDFDLENYYALRGEYITQYLRDLRPIFKKHHKKLAIALNAENMEWPQWWVASQQKDILHPGRIKMDWRTWVKEGLVDELNVWGGESPDKKIQDVQELLRVTKGTPVKVTVSYRQELPEKWRRLYDEGVRRVGELETPEEGYKEKRPVTDLDSKDPDAVMSVLRRLRAKEIEAPAQKVAALLSNPNPLVRRQAAFTIGTLRMQEALPELEKSAAEESEPSVKAIVFESLGKANGPNSLPAIVKGFAKVNTWPTRRGLLAGIAAMPPERYADVVASFDIGDTYYRICLMEALTRRGPVTEYIPLIMKGLADPSEDVRWQAVHALGIYPAREAAPLLLQALDDRSDSVQSRAAVSLRGMLPRVQKEVKEAIFRKLMAKYNQFGPNCKRSDHEWGWRPIGDALRDGFGAQGKNALIDILNGPNTELAKLAWKNLFLPEDSQWHLIPRAEMEKNYRYYPGMPDHIACPHVAVD
jgi:hypothetical protein